MKAYGLDSTDLGCNKETLKDQGFCVSRKNRDKLVNDHGTTLIEICQTYGLKICNGRFKSDKGGGIRGPINGSMIRVLYLHHNRVWDKQYLKSSSFHGTKMARK